MCWAQMSQDAEIHHYSQKLLQWHGIYKECLTMKYYKESWISDSKGGGKWQRPKLWWMDGVVEYLRKMGLQRWWMVATDRELLTESYMGNRGPKWAVELLMMMMIIIIIITKFTYKSYYIYGINVRMLCHVITVSKHVYKLHATAHCEDFNLIRLETSIPAR